MTTHVVSRSSEAGGNRRRIVATPPDFNLRDELWRQIKSNSRFADQHPWFRQARAVQQRALALGLDPKTAAELGRSQLTPYVAERLRSEHRGPTSPNWVGLVPRTFRGIDGSASLDGTRRFDAASSEFMGGLDILRMSDSSGDLLPRLQIEPYLTPSVDQSTATRFLGYGLKLAMTGLRAPTAVVLVSGDDPTWSSACRQLGFAGPSLERVWQSRFFGDGRRWHPGVPWEADLKGNGVLEIVAPEALEEHGRFARPQSSGDFVECAVFTMPAERWAAMKMSSHTPQLGDIGDYPKSHATRERADLALLELTYGDDLRRVLDDLGADVTRRRTRRSGRNGAPSAQDTYARVNTLRTTVAGASNRVFISDALAYVTKHPDDLRRRYIEPLAVRRVDSSPFDVPQWSPAISSTEKRLEATLRDGREAFPRQRPWRTLSFPEGGRSPRPGERTPDWRGSWEADRDPYPSGDPDADRVPRTNPNFVPRSPVGSDRSNFLCAVLGVIQGERARRQDDAEFLPYAIEAQRRQAEWVVAAEGAGLKNKPPNKQAKPVVVPTNSERHLTPEHEFEKLDMLMGVFGDNFDALYHLFANFPAALLRAVRACDQEKCNVTPPGKWTVLAMQAEVLRNAHAFVVPAMLGLERVQKLMGPPCANLSLDTMNQKIELGNRGKERKCCGGILHRCRTRDAGNRAWQEAEVPA